MITTRRRGYNASSKKKEPYLINPTGHYGYILFPFSPSSVDDVEIKFFTYRRAGYIINSTNFHCNFKGSNKVRFFNRDITLPEDVPLDIPITVKKIVQANGDFSIYVNDQVVYSDNIVAYNCGTLRLFGYDDVTSDWLFFGGIAYIKINNASGVRFYAIPKVVDGVCGMYDTISGTFKSSPSVAYHSSELIIEER